MATRKVAQMSSQSSSVSRGTASQAIEVMKNILMRPSFQEEHAASVDLISIDEVTELVDLSWRCQFDKDRSRMKKGLQEMFDHAISRREER